MNDALKLLRYNTGTDKKAFIDFKEEFDAVIFNATIVAYSGSAIADLVSMHKNRYIIDPQTHIFQHDTTAIKSKNKRTEEISIKKSVGNYLAQMPNELTNILLEYDRPATCEEVLEHKEALADSVYNFQVDFIKGHLKDKEYNKYLDFVGAGPSPKLLIAPYFMIKKEYSDQVVANWFGINREMINEFSKKHQQVEEIAAQLVLDKKVLTNPDFIELVTKTYTDSFCTYVFIWIDDFSTFFANKKEQMAFFELLKAFKTIGKKPVMAYGGYDSIFLCNNEIENRLYGVAQSVGYGEKREITPVGGGLPINKYYFLPTHQRVKFSEAADILNKNGYFSSAKTHKEHALDYYKEICNCSLCRKEVIRDDINNFEMFNESTPFVFKKTGISRRRPTTDASLIAAKHFLGCKIYEWKFVKKNTLEKIKGDLVAKVEKYNPDMIDSVREWCNIYAR